MRSLSRRHFSAGVLSLLAAACGGKVEDERTATATPGTRPPGQGTADPPPPFPPSTPGGGPEPLLGLSPVDLATPPPAVVWSWTTAEQAAELRAGGVLFSRESSPTLGRGYLFELLQNRADLGDATAARLVDAQLAKGRFGWHNPWSTVRGATAGESYGLELLAIRMKPDTLFARVLASRGEITFVDSAGADVPTATALAAYGRVGGILFDNDVSSLSGCGTGGGGGGGTGPSGGGQFYREIYLGNEAQIASYSHRTAPMLTVLDAAIGDLVTLRTWMASAGYPSETTLFNWQCRAAALWSWAGPGSTIDRYLASLAFSDRQYLPTNANLTALLSELGKARFTPDPFTVTP